MLLVGSVHGTAIAGTGDAPAGRSTAATDAKASKPARAKKPAAPAKPTAHAHRGRAPSRGIRVATRRDAAGPLSPDETLAIKLAKLWEDRALREGTTAVCVVDSTSGTPIYAMHPDDPLNPASNVKLVSTAAALHVLGPAHRFETRVLGPAPAADGAIRGDLYLLGSYDPTLIAGDLDELADQLAAAGITRVDGDLIVGPSATRDGLYHAAIEIEVTGAAAAGAPPTVTVRPATALVDVDVTAQTTAARRRGRAGKAARQTVRDAVTVDAELLRIATDGDDDGERGRYLVTVGGEIPAGTTATFSRDLDARALFSAALLRAALADAGIALSGDVRTAELSAFLSAARERRFLPIELAAHRSQPLSAIVAKINKRSINWLADRLIMVAGAALIGGEPSMDKGVVAMKQWLTASAGIAEDAVLLDTGSGLSYNTQLSARQVVDVLRAGGGLGAALDTADRQTAQAYLDSLAVGGEDGTLKSRFKRSSVKGKIRGKTGTLTRILALAGILPGTTPATGLAFAIVTNGHATRHKARIKKLHEQMVELLADYLAARDRAAGTAAASTAARSPAVPTASAADDSITAGDLDGDSENE